MKLTSFYQKSTKYRAVLFSGTLFEKYRQKYRSTTDGTFNKLPSTGTAGTLIKYRAHLWQCLHAIVSHQPQRLGYF